jgi:hypothetical protein
MIGENVSNKSLPVSPSPSLPFSFRVIYKPSRDARESLAALDDYLPTLLNFRKPLETVSKPGASAQRLVQSAGTR